MTIRKATLLFSILVFCNTQGQVFFNINMRTYEKMPGDTSGSCHCQLAYDVNNDSICLTIDSIKITVYQNNQPVKTVYTNRYGNCSEFSLPEGKYRFVYTKQGFDTAHYVLNLSETTFKEYSNKDATNILPYEEGRTMGGFNFFDHTAYSCITLARTKKHGVRIVPRKQ